MSRFTFALGILLLGAIPRIVSAAPPPLEAYSKLPHIEFMRLSPSGKRIAFVSVDGDTRRLFIRDLGGDALLAPKVEKTKVRGLHWAGDDFVVMDVSVTQTHEYYSKYKEEVYNSVIINLKTKEVRSVFEKNKT